MEEEEEEEEEEEILRLSSSPEISFWISVGENMYRPKLARGSPDSKASTDLNPEIKAWHSLAISTLSLKLATRCT